MAIKLNIFHHLSKQASWSFQNLIFMQKALPGHAMGSMSRGVCEHKKHIKLSAPICREWTKMAKKCVKNDNSWKNLFLDLFGEESDLCFG